jgi:hypothetical protein
MSKVRGTYRHDDNFARRQKRAVEYDRAGYEWDGFHTAKAADDKLGKRAVDIGFPRAIVNG